MAKSRLIARRKKSTVLVSVRTVENAIMEANKLVEESMMGNDSNVPDMDAIENAVAHMSKILKATPQQMSQDGVSSVADYMDDAVKPEEARKLKSEVDMILKMRSSKRQPAQGVGYVPNSAVAEGGIHASQKRADGGAAFVSDRDEQSEAKAPEHLEVPRVAKKKVKEAEDPTAEAGIPAPAAPIPAAAGPTSAPAAPAAGPATAGNPIDYIPTETLIKVIGDLPKEEDFAQNKGKQDAVVQLTEILKSRPVLPPEQDAAPAAPATSTAPALAAPVAASAKKRADLGDHAMGQGDTISNGSGAAATVGQGGSTSTPKPISTDSGISSAPQKSNAIDLGGLNVASSLEDDKTADYRMNDYKITQEGVRPEFKGGLPGMDEQEEHGSRHGVDFPNEQEETPVPSNKHNPVPAMASVKVGVTPPGISEELMHKLKKEYPGDKEKAYATAWSIHNKKESALKAISAAFDNFASAGYGGGWYTSYKPMDVTEDGGRTPEIGEAHSHLEDNTGISHPATTEPIKLNGQQSLKTGSQEMATSKAVKEAEKLGNELKKMYLDAKSLTVVNDTRSVREAVEAIFRAADMFDEATKTLNKQHQQEESEAEAAKIKSENKGKKSAYGGLAVAAGE